MAKKNTIAWYEDQLESVRNQYLRTLDELQALKLVINVQFLPPGFRYVSSPKGYNAYLTHVDNDGFFQYWSDSKTDTEWKELELELFRTYGDNDIDYRTLTTALAERRSFHAKLKAYGSLPFSG